LNDLCLEKNIDILLITETWLNGDKSDDPIINELLPCGYKVIQQPRIGQRGGGIAIIYKSTIKTQLKPLGKCNGFEHCEVKITIKSFTSTVACIYRPPPSTNNTCTVSTFMEEFDTYLGNLVV
jgi:hypothetical protein